MASDFLSQQLSNLVTGHGVFTEPGKFVALSSTDPGDDGAGITEPVGGAYARVETLTADWSVPTLAVPSISSNVNTVTFLRATADWVSGVDIAFWAVFDALTGGNFLISATITPGSEKPILNGDLAFFDPGILVWSIS